MKTLIHLITAAGPSWSRVSRKTVAGRRHRPWVGLIILLFALGAASTRASDPIGIYALVDKVVLEPNDTAPERIQIQGAFVFAKGFGSTYETPKRGFLYYKLVAEKKEVCLKEWADLKSLAGKKQVVGFGNRHKEKGTIRKENDQPANPDVYPIGFGLVKAKDNNYEPVRALLELGQVKKKDDAK